MRTQHHLSCQAVPPEPTCTPPLPLVALCEPKCILKSQTALTLAFFALVLIAAFAQRLQLPSLGLGGGVAV